MATTPRPRHEAVREAARSLSRILKAMHDYSRRMDLRYGVSGPQLWLLWHLRVTPGLPVRELAERMFQHPSTVTRLVDGLESKGLVARGRDDADRRVVHVYLTAEGRGRLRGVPTPVRQRLLRVLEDLPEDLLAPTAQALAILAEAADSAARGGMEAGLTRDGEDG